MHLIMSELSFLGELYFHLFSLSPFANWNNLHVAFEQSDFPTICWCKPPLFSNSPLVRTESSQSPHSSKSCLHINTSMQMVIKKKKWNNVLYIQIFRRSAGRPRAHQSAFNDAFLMRQCIWVNAHQKLHNPGDLHRPKLQTHLLHPDVFPVSW